MVHELLQEARNDSISFKFLCARLISSLKVAALSNSRILLKSWLRIDTNTNTFKHDNSYMMKENPSHFSLSSAMSTLENEGMIWTFDTEHAIWNIDYEYFTKLSIQVEAYEVPYDLSNCDKHDVESILGKPCKLVGLGRICLANVYAKNAEEYRDTIVLTEKSQETPFMEIEVSICQRFVKFIGKCQRKNFSTSTEKIDTCYGCNHSSNQPKNELIPVNDCVYRTISKTLKKSHADVRQNTNHPHSPTNNGYMEEEHTFILTISLIGTINLESLEGVPVSESIWFSYQFNGVIVQTDPFQVANMSSFPPSSEKFHISKENDENETIVILLCTSGAVIGHGVIDLVKSLQLDKWNNLIKGYVCLQKNGNRNNPQSLLLAPSPNLPQIILSLRLQINEHDNALPMKDDKFHSKKSKSLESYCLNDEYECIQPTKSRLISKKLFGNITKYAMDFSGDQTIDNEIAGLILKWEQWRYNEEIKWREQLVKKEKKMRVQLEKKLHEQQKESTKLLDTSRVAYKNLEQRLLKLLSEVEKKDKEIQSIQLVHESKWEKKYKELEHKENKSFARSKHLVQVAEMKVSDTLKEMEKWKQAAYDAKLRTDFAEQQLEKNKGCNVQAELRSKILQLQSDFDENKFALKKKIMEVEELQQTTKKLTQSLRCEKEKNAAIMGEYQRKIVNNDTNGRVTKSRDLGELKRISNELSQINFSKDNSSEVNTRSLTKRITCSKIESLDKSKGP